MSAQKKHKEDSDSSTDDKMNRLKQLASNTSSTSEEENSSSTNQPENANRTDNDNTPTEEENSTVDEVEDSIPDSELEDETADETDADTTAENTGPTDYPDPPEGVSTPDTAPSTNADTTDTDNEKSIAKTDHTEPDTEEQTDNVAEEPTPPETETANSTQPESKTAIDSGILKKFIGYTTTFQDEAQININESGFETYTPDEANVGLVRSKLHQSGFDNLEASPTQVGIDVDQLNEGLDLFDNKDTLQLEYDEATQSHRISDGELSFNFSFINLDYIETLDELPNINYSVDVEVSYDEFAQIVKAADMVGDTIRIKTDNAENSVTLYSQSDSDETEQTFTREETNSLEINDSIESLYSLEYIKDINTAISNTTETIRIQAANDMPIKITVEEEHVTTEFLVAPKIEDQE